jgi:hypothetical protein
MLLSSQNSQVKSQHSTLGKKKCPKLIKLLERTNRYQDSLHQNRHRTASYNQVLAGSSSSKKKEFASTFHNQPGANKFSFQVEST